MYWFYICYYIKYHILFLYICDTYILSIIVCLAIIVCGSNSPIKYRKYILNSLMNQPKLIKRLEKNHGLYSKKIYSKKY
jgi:hypothetical protein